MGILEHTRSVNGFPAIIDLGGSPPIQTSPHNSGANIKALCFFGSSRIAFVADDTVVAYEYSSTLPTEPLSWTKLSVHDSKIRGSGNDGRLALSFKAGDERNAGKELLLLNRECGIRTLRIEK